MLDPGAKEEEPCPPYKDGMKQCGKYSARVALGILCEHRGDIYSGLGGGVKEGPGFKGQVGL